MISRCVMCGYDEIEDVMEPISTTLDGVTFTRTVPAEKCPGCGEGYYRADVLRAFDIWIERQLLNLPDQYGPEQKEFLRKQDLARKKHVEVDNATPWSTAENLCEELWGAE